MNCCAMQRSRRFRAGVSHGRHGSLSLTNTKQERQTLAKLSILREFWEFLRVRKKYWLAPIMIFIILLSAIIVLTQQSALAPFIYTLF